MFAIFVIGTAGSGKSLLSSALGLWYQQKGASSIIVNLDPGVIRLPYTPDVDIRNYIQLDNLMDQYQLGPNGALILASDLLATKLEEIQSEVDEMNPTYAIFDTPGQIELFAFRESGQFITKNLRMDGKSSIYLFDPSLVSSPTNFVSVSLLAASIQLQLDLPQIAVLTKKDILKDAHKKIMVWSSKTAVLEDAIYSTSPGTQYILSRNLLQNLVKSGVGSFPIPISSVTLDGMINLTAALSRIFQGGEEIDD